MRAFGVHPPVRGRAPALLSSLLVAVLLVIALLAGATTAAAQPTPPAPPPNPSDGQIAAGQDAVEARAAEVAGLTTRLAELDERADELQVELAGRRETAEAALVDLAAARAAAGAAAAAADRARQETDAATASIEAARVRVDELLASIYAQGPDLGPIALLAEATGPDDLVNRAEYGAMIAEQQRTIQESLEKARIGKANTDSTARAALDEAQARRAAAAAAKTAADGALAEADAAARAQLDRLAEVGAQRAEIQARLDAAVSADAGLREQRTRYERWQAEQAAAEAAAARAAQEEAARRVAAVEPATGSDTGAAGAPAARPAGGGTVQRVIDRAMAQLGVQYVWGGGNGRGPSTGIPDGLGSPLDRIGFDCSGLMLYAFNGAGVSLPRVSRNQFNAGRKVPMADRRPGDMLFWAHPGKPIHHVAMYIGNGKMIEAPYTGASVRITKVRTKGLLPEVTRML